MDQETLRLVVTSTGTAPRSARTGPATTPTAPLGWSVRAPSRRLCEVVARSTAVRAIGSRHSFSDLTDTTGTLLDLAGLPAGIRLDDDSTAVSVGGGVRYGDLAVALEEQGRALAAMASLPHISVAGAVATGTHGSGDRTPSLAAAVRALEIVGPGGVLRRVRRGEPDFDGSVVGLGALGVVTRVELDVEPTYEVHQEVRTGLAWGVVETRFDEITAAAYSVSLFTRFEDGVDQVWLKHRTATGGGGAARTLLRHASPRSGRCTCCAAGRREAVTTQGGVPGAWLDRLPHFRLAFTPSNGAELQSEYFVAREHALDAVERLRRMSSRLAPLLEVAEIRTIAADELWLSGAHGRDTVALHFTWVRDEPAVRRVVREIEEALVPLGARPHWGKVFEMDAGALADAFPRLPDFAALRDRVDPDRVFGNAFLDRVLRHGLTTGPEPTRGRRSRASRAARALRRRGPYIDSVWRPRPRPRPPSVSITPAQDRPFWRRTWLVVGVLVLTLFVAFVVWRGASTIYYVLMAWFVALAMEPAVSKLAPRMRRGLATGVVMLLVGRGPGRLRVDLRQPVRRPGRELHRGRCRTSPTTPWRGSTGSPGRTSPSTRSSTGSGITPGDIAAYADDVALGVLNVIGAILSGFFGLFILALLRLLRLRRDAAPAPVDRPPDAPRPAGALPRGLGPHRDQGRRLHRGPRRAGRGQLDPERHRLRPDRAALLAAAGPVDRHRRPVRAQRRHLHLHRAAGARRAHLGRAGPRRLRADLGHRLPAGREPHHRAAHLGPRRRPAPGRLLRRGPARRAAVRAVRSPARRAGGRHGHGDARDLQAALRADPRDRGAGRRAGRPQCGPRLGRPQDDDDGRRRSPGAGVVRAAAAGPSADPGTPPTTPTARSRHDLSTPQDRRHRAARPRRPARARRRHRDLDGAAR